MKTRGSWGVVVVLVALGGGATAPAQAASSARTQAIVYSPFAASGRPGARVVKTVRGHCWTGSIAAYRQDAWRCMSGNYIYDPCFSSPRAPGIVLCPVSGPWTPTVVKIKLTHALPTKYGNPRPPSTNGLPWALITTSGWRCRLVTGATAVLDGKRAAYGCTATSSWLWGAPLRRAHPWRIYAAPINARRLSRKVAIRTAWF